MHLKVSSAICFNLDSSKILSSGNPLNNKTLHQIRAKFKAIADDTLDVNIRTKTPF